ncbi:MAG TPA: TIR domain-containing protein, partial [Polyangiaceae bacterium]|nr:TIR domain-containing protein [Polyangiaceae bacterium]
AAAEQGLSSTVVIAPDAGVSPERSAQAVSEPSRALASEDEQEGATSSSRPSSYPSADHDVQFTIYRPESIPPEVWRKLVVFVHKTRAETPEDPDPVQTVAELAQRLLGETMAEYQPTHQDGPSAIPHETEISLVPYASGVEFNPREQRFAWLEPVHHSEFRMLARAELDGQTIHGGVRAFIGILLVADVPLRIEVSSTAPEEPHQSVTAGLLRRVFPSYSHADPAIVALCERCAEVLGLHYLRDVRTLRAGEHWSARLAERIREANVFQLFWSTNSMRSPYVRAEWEQALELGKRVCPVYWETPFPEAPNEDLPPSALRALHFVDLSGQRQSREIRSKDGPELLAATLHSEAPPGIPPTVAGEESRADANRTPSLSPSFDATPANTPRAEEEDLADLAAYLPRHSSWWYVIAFVCIATLVAVLLYFVVAAG